MITSLTTTTLKSIISRTSPYLPSLSLSCPLLDRGNQRHQPILVSHQVSRLPSCPRRRSYPSRHARWRFSRWPGNASTLSPRYAVVTTPRTNARDLLLTTHFRQIDIKKLARLTGYTEGSASVTIGKIKRKLKIHAGGDADGGTPTSTPRKAAAKTPRSTKRATKDFDTPQETPSKRRKQASSVASEPSAYQEDEEEYMIKTEDDANDNFAEYGSYGGYPDYDGSGNY